MSFSRPESHPRPATQELVRFLTGANNGFVLAKVLSKNHVHMPEMVGPFPLPLALAAITPELNARIGDFLRLILTDPNPQKALGRELKKLGGGNKIKGSILFFTKELIKLGMTAGLAWAISLTLHAFQLFDKDNQSGLAKVLQNSIAAPYIFGAVGYLIGFLFRTVERSCSSCFSGIIIFA